MTGDRDGSRRLVGAALLAAVVALGLIAIGWWPQDWEHDTDRSRFLDASWWAGVGTSFLGHLAFGKLGFKIALLTLGGATAALFWRRQRRATSTMPLEDDGATTPLDHDSTPPGKDQGSTVSAQDERSVRTDRSPTA